MSRALSAVPLQGHWLSWTNNSATHRRRRLHTLPLAIHPSKRKGIREQPFPSCVHACCAKWFRMALGHSADPELAAHQVQKNQSLRWSFSEARLRYRAAANGSVNKRQRSCPLGFSFNTTKPWQVYAALTGWWKLSCCVLGTESVPSPTPICVGEAVQSWLQDLCA